MWARGEQETSRGPTSTRLSRQCPRDTARVPPLQSAALLFCKSLGVTGPSARQPAANYTPVRDAGPPCLGLSAFVRQREKRQIGRIVFEITVEIVTAYTGVCREVDIFKREHVSELLLCG